MKYQIGNYNTAVLSGGSNRGIATLGALQFLDDHGKLERISKYIGTSIGAIIGYLVSIGYSPIEIFIYINQKKIIEKMITSVSIVDLVNLGYALNYMILQDYLEQMTLSKIGHFLTLKQLNEEFGKHLVCCVYNYDKKICEYIDYCSHPNIPCLTVLRMTSNLPFVFSPFKYENQIYIDGGVLNNFPISQIEKEDIAIGINLISKENESSSKSKNKNKKKPFSFFNYVFEIIYIPIHNMQKYLRKEVINEPHDIIEIGLDIDIFSWNIPISEKMNIFSTGYESLKNYFQVKYIIPWIES